MPRLSCWFVRSAFTYLVLGFTMGGFILAAKVGEFDPRGWVWLPSHVDALVVGWLIQLAMGVAYWILPRMRERYRGRVGLVMAAFVLLNAGLVLGVWVPALQFWLPGLPWMRYLLPAGVLLQTAGLLLFALHAWPRVLPTITAADVRKRRTGE